MSDTIHRVNHQIRQRRLHVLRVADLTPRMRRITLGGQELQGFTSLGSDDHIKLLFAETAEQQQAIDARNLGRDGGVRPTMREYTPRRIDLVNNELDIDFVLHGDGPASTWAAQAAPGQTLDIAGPRASMVVPDIFDSYLLIGDETAIPAIGRRLEELPAGRKVLAVVQIEDDQERQPLESKAQLEIIWVHRNEDLLARIEALGLPEGDLYSWVALEKSLTRQVKALLLEKGVKESALKAAAYWRADGTADDE
ncbi:MULTISPECIES: siderophore-interacting protein [Pseudomonas]|uniref:Siderophore-interacting protein n=1 Tax=Pseudomonas taiwanensis TaxID=470150 RepID=A0ABR6VA86_9PSED|nr:MULTISPECIES: siderophore-interacting protein [Pseudomonas]AGZ33860.1 FAD-binding 9 siderophore-interacting domain-containing protein [Pseudomonas sp. VLB120]AVD86792.1 siderophore-interacting protein [Pseudomonas sp. SWI44]MBC3476797.1 siderophore-interacting protein [Pseudomonas taiwanensis]MBC3490855.1 siderophore-interacting protein [Pseudomonas taiwanensis]MDT8925628.1 siderophore-interacting protein [Pseudomonas taiwanensis]